MIFFARDRVWRTGWVEGFQAYAAYTIDNDDHRQGHTAMLNRGEPEEKLPDAVRQYGGERALV